LSYRFKIGDILVLDANVLWHTHLLGLLIYCHHKTILSLKWTDSVVHEAENGMRAKGRTHQAAKLRPLLDYAGVGTRVTDYKRHEGGVDLPDEDDRHVLAAAIACDADAIVTSNNQDFPAAVLKPYSITALSPDGLLQAILDNDDAAGVLIAACLRQPLPAAGLLARLEKVAPEATGMLRKALNIS
jgi:predicted nucleic acid-binding protein